MANRIGAYLFLAGGLLLGACGSTASAYCDKASSCNDLGGATTQTCTTAVQNQFNGLSDPGKSDCEKFMSACAGMKDCNDFVTCVNDLNSGGCPY